MDFQAFNLTPKECFQIANHAFPQKGCPFEGWDILETKTFYKKGFTGTAYKNANKKICLLTFFVFANVDINQETIAEAKKFAKQIHDKGKDLRYHVILTGFRRGGSLAEFCALQNKLTTFTFDSVAIFTESPKNNHYTHINRYVSEKEPEVLYGNMYYVDIFKAIDNELLERWQSALEKLKEEKIN
jgi:hypothetical protein